MRALLLALHLLTRLPGLPAVTAAPADHGRAVLYYPLVGLFIGSVLALGVVLIRADTLLVAALVLVLWVALTGALHLDGLADTADAWLGSHGDRARALDIMKDPRSGPAAVVAVMLVLLVKFAALAVLVRAQAWLAVLAVPVLGRAALVAWLRFTPYVRPQGLGAQAAATLPPRAALVSLGIALLLALWWQGPAPVLAASAGVMGWHHAARRWFGGVTGDVLGAGCELVETLALVTLALPAGAG
jgi:adenosylcobinamide-GDP ribazoletransferase